MEKFDRLYQIHQLLTGRRTCTPLRDLAEHLECSEKTVKRYIDQLRDFFGAPLEYIPHDGWRLIPGEEWEIPGLWLTGDELQSLVLLLDILHRFGNGLLSEELVAIENRIDSVLAVRGIERSTLDERVKIIPLGYRMMPSRDLHRAFQALVDRKQLALSYCDYHGRTSERLISPQRLIYYRDNWYLDAWCHKRNGLRSFMLSRVESLTITPEAASNITCEQLDETLGAAYGIFSGKPDRLATLRFFPSIARDIAQQQWHPDQTGEWEGDDYLLTLPYSDERELTQDILRLSPGVYVESPVGLRHTVQEKLQAGLEVMANKRIPRV